VRRHQQRVANLVEPGPVAAGLELGAIALRGMRQPIGELPQWPSVQLLGRRGGQVQEVGPGECRECAGHEASQAWREHQADLC